LVADDLRCGRITGDAAHAVYGVDPGVGEDD